MDGEDFAGRFKSLMAAYMKDRREDHLARISELGEDLVRSFVPPEDIGEIFQEALLEIASRHPDLALLDAAEKASVPLVELLIAYGLAFRHQRHQQRLYEETRLAKRVIENTLEGIWMADAEGRIQLANPAFSAICACDPAQLPGEEVSGFFDDGERAGAEDLAPLREVWREVRRRGMWRGEVMGRRRDGRFYPAFLNVCAIADEDGRPSGYVGVVDDITERKEREKALALEMARAREIYELLVQPRLPVMDGLWLDVECIPAENVGGDTLEVLRIDDRRLLLFLADVTGHGVPAAMTANAIKMIFREISGRTVEPATICTRLNRALIDNILPDDVIAAFCALVDLDAMTLTYCLCGLPLPLLLRGGLPIRLQPTGLPLGVFENFGYLEKVLPLREGDLFLAFTDGLTEVVGPRGDVFGSAGVEKAVLAGGYDQGSVVRHLLEKAASFQGGGLFRDDIIVLAAGIPSKEETREGGGRNRFCSSNGCYLALKTRDADIDALILEVMEVIAAKTRLSPGRLQKTRMAFFEILTNAVEHGNLEMTAVKRDPEVYGSEAYGRIFNERMRSRELGERRLIIDCHCGSKEIRLSVEDDGPGFAPEHVTDPAQGSNVDRLCGRGLVLARMNADALSFNPRGNKATLLVKLS